MMISGAGIFYDRLTSDGPKSARPRFLLDHRVAPSADAIARSGALSSSKDLLPPAEMNALKRICTEDKPR